MPPAHATLPPRDEMLRAFMASDRSYEGIFYTAVRTTAIFCRPTCSARKPKPENVDFYRSADDALSAGFRPCKRCRPLEVADAPDWVTRYRYAAAPGDHAHLEALERELAMDVGKPGGARIAGWACGRNRIAIAIPCHRVVAADGALTGYGGGKARKAYLLNLERGATSAFAAPT